MFRVYLYLFTSANSATKKELFIPDEETTSLADVLATEIGTAKAGLITAVDGTTLVFTRTAGFESTVFSINA